MSEPASHATPAVILSLPCPRCGERAEPDRACVRCAGEGIVLRRVPPEQAALPAERLRGRPEG